MLIASATTEATDALLPSALLACAEARAALSEPAAARLLLDEYRRISNTSRSRQHGPLLLQEANVLLALGDTDGANAAYVAALAAFGGNSECLHPACAHAQLHLARIAAKRGEMVEAKSLLGKAKPVLTEMLVETAPTLRLLADFEARL